MNDCDLYEMDLEELKKLLEELKKLNQKVASVLFQREHPYQGVKK